MTVVEVHFLTDIDPLDARRDGLVVDDRGGRGVDDHGLSGRGAGDDDRLAAFRAGDCCPASRSFTECSAGQFGQRKAMDMGQTSETDIGPRRPPPGKQITPASGTE